MYIIRTFQFLFAALLLAATPLATFAGPAEDQYAVAAGHYSHQRWQLAHEEFESFLKLYPDHAKADTTFFFWAETLVQLGRFDDARSRYQEFLQQAPEHRYAAQAMFRLGETAYLAGKLEQAKTDLVLFYKQHSGHALNAYALPYLGEAALRDQQWEQAGIYFTKAQREFPAGPLQRQCDFGLARVRQHQGKQDEAFIRFRQLAEQQTLPLADQAQLQIGKLYYQRGQFSQARLALEGFEKAFPQSPQHGEALYYLGLTLAEQQDWQAAAQNLSKAAEIETDPELLPAILFSTAEAFRHGGDLDSAKQAYGRILQDWPNSAWADDSLQAGVQIAFKRGEHVWLEKLTKQFIERYPESRLLPMINQAVGRSLLKQERYNESIDLFVRLLKLENTALFQPTGKQESDTKPAADEAKINSNRAQGSFEEFQQANRYYLALAYLGALRYDESLAQIENIDPSAKQKELTESLYVARASALVGLKRFTAAIEPLKQYLSVQPDGEDAMSCRAQLTVSLAHAKRWEEAQDAYRELTNHDVTKSVYLATTLYLAESAYSSGEGKLAEELFEILSEPSNPPEYAAKGLSGLAWSRLETDSPAESVEAFERLLREHPDSPLAPEAAIAQARMLEKNDKLEPALAMYYLVIDRYGESKPADEAFLAAAKIHDSLEQDQEAVKLLQRFVDERAQSSRLDAALYQWAWALEDLQQSDKATEQFKRLADEFQQSQFWGDAVYRLAERSVRSGAYEQADRRLDQLLKANPQDEILLHALYLKGQVAAATGRWSEVVEPMQRVLDEFPGNELQLSADYWAAEAYYRQGKYEEADRRFSLLERKAQGRSDSWLAMVPLRRAQTLAQNDKWAEAYDMAITISKRYPNFRRQYEADYLIGRCLASLARFEEAREVYEQVVRSPGGGATETAAMAQWMIGETYFHQEKFDEAIKAYHRVVQLYGFPRWQAGSLLQAGKCREMKGQWKEAVGLYSQLIKEFPNELFKQEASRRLRVARQRASLINSSR